MTVVSIVCVFFSCLVCVVCLARTSDVCEIKLTIRKEGPYCYVVTKLCYSLEKVGGVTIIIVIYSCSDFQELS